MLEKDGDRPADDPYRAQLLVKVESTLTVLAPLLALGLFPSAAGGGVVLLVNILLSERKELRD